MKDLRKELKLLKALQGISYTEIAEYLEIRRTSLYTYLNGQYELSAEKQSRLYEIICNLRE